MWNSSSTGVPSKYLELYSSISFLFTCTKRDLGFFSISARNRTAPKKKKKRPCEGELNVLTHPISWIRIGFFIFGHSPPRPLVFVVLLPQHVAFGDVSEHMVMLWKLLGMIGSQLKSLKSKPDEWFPEGFQNIWPCCTKGLIYSQVTGHT